MEDLKIRCSSLGKIMTNPRSKSELLSKTCMTYLQELAKEERWGITKEYKNKYFDKGNEVEDKSIQLANDVLGYGFLFKNEESFSNDFITGTPDINTDEVLIEIKSSWDGTTFPFFEKDLPDKAYYYQLQGYMALTGKKKAYLCYCLVNTPDEMVADEVRRQHWKNYLIDDDENLTAEVESKHNFDHIEKEDRLKKYEVLFDEDLMQKIEDRIKICRNYYKTLF